MTPAKRVLTADAARALLQPTEPWLSCEECFESMDVYVDALLIDPGTAAMPEMLVHLRACGACAEETESLLLLVAGTDGMDAAQALSRIRRQV